VIRVTLTETIVNSTLRMLFRILYRIDAREMRKLPSEGPALLMTNHTSNLEGPAYYVFMQPSRATALGKVELWNNPFTRFLMRLWQIIPLHRDQVDREAIRLAVGALRDRYIVGIAPEGTRSKRGVMRKAHPGIALLATRLPVPVYPVAHWGFTEFRRNLARLRRTTVVFKVGEPFYIDINEGARISAADLREIADQMMYRVASLLPEQMRGYYRDLSRASSELVKPVGAGKLVST
jgi:1-acyl-sn-glycerol-3-phosphate acyltransferase